MKTFCYTLYIANVQRNAQTSACQVFIIFVQFLPQLKLRNSLS